LLRPPQKRTLEAREQRRNLLMLMPLTLFLLVLFIAPLLFIFLYAFGYYDAFGRATGALTLRNFQALVDPSTFTLFWKTSAVAAAVTALCFLLGYPTAWVVSEQTPRRRNLLVMLIMVPFWTSYLLRTFSMMLIFRGSGLANAFLQGTGLVQGDVFDIGTAWAVIWTEAYAYMVFMILPIYATLERMPRSFIEASYILGAGRVRTFARVILPLSIPGILAGSLLVFILSMGEVVIPYLLGGIEANYLMGNAIFVSAPTTPGYAGALGLVFMGVVLVIAMVYIRAFGREGLRL
jgi:spermidine/putrescine transport system permease protein